jgi:hypothetical protein
MTALIVIIWVLAAALLAALVVASVWRQSAAQRLAKARAEVRTALSAFAQPGRGKVRPDLDWWLERIEALDHELTPALAENPAVRAALEGLSSAAAAQALPLTLAAAPAGGRHLSRLDRLGRLTCLAPTRASRRALLALQAGADRGLALRASATIARHAASFADASAPLACVADLERDPMRLLAARWALGCVTAADPKRAAVHAQDEAAAVRSAVLAHLDPRAIKGAADAPARVQAVALPHVADADATVRAAAFTALGRAAAPMPAAPLQHGLNDADASVRLAAARALPAGGRDALTLLPVVERADPGVARNVGRAMRTGPQARHAEPDAEMRAVAALDAADVGARRTAALTLASIARNRTGARLQAATVAALLGRLETESAGSVSAALVEALEASADDHAATALSTLSLRARPEWRLRLTEASSLARRLRGATPSGPTSPDRVRSSR